MYSGTGNMRMRLSFINSLFLSRKFCFKNLTNINFSFIFAFIKAKLYTKKYIYPANKAKKKKKKLAYLYLPPVIQNEK